MVCFDLIGGMLSSEAYEIAQLTPTMMNNVRCKGNETLIQSCSHDPWGTSRCRGNVLMLICYPSRCMESSLFGLAIVLLS